MIPVIVLAASGADSKVPDFALEDKVREVAEGLRCVVCQNLSVADSPSDLAKEMRNLFVILSEDCSLRDKRKEQPQSKDPYHLPSN